MWTPWGKADHQHELADGIVFYGTPGHGGFKIAPELNAQIPAPFRIESGWYEEDVEWAIPAFVFPEPFVVMSSDDINTPELMKEYAADRLRNWMPDQWEEATGDKLVEGQSHMRDKAVHEQANVDNFLGKACWGSWHEEVPDGMVGVFAKRESDGAEAYFLIADEVYDAPRGPSGKIVLDLERDQPWDTAMDDKRKAVRA